MMSNAYKADSVAALTTWQGNNIEMKQSELYPSLIRKFELLKDYIDLRSMYLSLIQFI